MKNRFGIDIDGTVTCPSSLIPYLNHAFNLNITLNDVKQYDLNHLVDISEEEFANWFAEIEPVIYAESPLAEGAKHILNKWEKEHELFFISARGSHLLDLTKEWFLRNALSFHHIDLIGTHNKIKAAKEYKVDIFFEDKHDNAVMLHEECKIPVILFDTPYNQEPIPSGVIRVKNWAEANIWVENWLKEEKKQKNGR
ncbi:hypothetical protein [Cytobacillus dafuensis]|uniref:Nucleotidase n=1 Tax=Cytobacillus dafuensis TaxID=1742359 RepID=A0A5B8Z6E7_CYTDA|nr:hypothetical protein [Cytobacillus dafuensis]QED48655.1 hypothetical protein FSZ17_16140 [Cytobacillus dafuensis]